MTEETGGGIGIRDDGLLDSAFEDVLATFDGKELYPPKEEKAARLGFALITNHAFLDGNKRIGVYVMITFPEINGISVQATNEEVEEVGLAVASGEIKCEGLQQWSLTTLAEGKK